MAARMDRSRHARLGIVLKRTGGLLFGVALLWYFLGMLFVSNFVKGNKLLRASLLIILIEGVIILLSVLIFCLGKYTFGE